MALSSLGEPKVETRIVAVMGWIFGHHGERPAPAGELSGYGGVGYHVAFAFRLVNPPALV